MAHNSKNIAAALTLLLAGCGTVSRKACRMSGGTVIESYEECAVNAFGERVCRDDADWTCRAARVVTCKEAP